jgi:signal transduction histidine kinase
MRRMFQRLLTAFAIALLTPWWMSYPLAQAQPDRTVLTIHWGPEEFPGTSVVDAAIREALLSPDDSPLRYYSEYLETEEFPPEAASLAFRDYIRQKFAGRRIDLVIANSTPALQFALRYRPDLFPGVPIVFVAGSLPGVTIGSTPPGMTGVLSDAAWAETLELALSLHPSVRRVFVVAQAPTSDSYDERIRAALDPFSDRVQLTYIKETSVSDLLAAVKGIPAQSLIFYARYTPEDGESIVYPDEVVRLMAQVSPVPIYVAADMFFGTGVVGGMIKGSRAIGTRLGELARQILDGTRPEDLPIQAVPGVPTFDWRQLQRWGIDAARLPPGSDVQFRAATAFESYRPYIIGTTIVVVVQLLLIAGLLTQRASRRRAEATVLAREATLRTSYQRIRSLAGRLINAQEVARAGLARDLHDGMTQELACVSMLVNTLKSSSGRIQEVPTQQALSRLQDETQGILERVRRLSHELHPANLRLLGLAATLQVHCSEVARLHGVRVNFTPGGDLQDVHTETAVSLFRIAQESLQNGVEHGKAQRFTVLLTRSGERIELTVTDDGCGFDLEAVRRDGKGLGLLSIEERAHAVGGDVQIVTGPGAGTTIRVRCPSAIPSQR